MAFLEHLPAWLLALIIFTLRVGDVTLGTIRTISVVRGMIVLSVVLGFVEVLVWITAISQVMSSISEHPLLLLAYAGGFAVGNAVGIALERKIALGMVVLRMISMRAGLPIAARLREAGERVTTFPGEGRDGPVVLLFVICARRRLREVVELALSVDPSAVYSVESVQEWGPGVARPLPDASGWRAIFKKK